MICIADRCGQNSRNCPCPERCDMLNDPLPITFVGPEPKTLAGIERWALRAFIALVIGLAVWAVVINWRTVQMLWAVT